MNNSLHTERLNIVIAGHVDHGKSTIVGRLLADSGALPDGKLAQVKAYCERNAKPFEYAFLVDALKAEQSQGVTIDSARVFFRAGGREYVFIDAPGHIDFVKNMVSGAARADAALLVIDAGEGIQENSRRHATLLSMLGIRQLVVLVNKMDLVDYRREKFEKICAEFAEYLGRLQLEPSSFIPVSGLSGENVVRRGKPLAWYSGRTVLGCLSGFRAPAAPLEKPFRMWVQDVYKFTEDGDTRRIVAGTVETGKINVGDEIVFYPSGKRSRVRSIEGFDASARTLAVAGQATGLTLSEQVYVPRGELIVKSEDPRPQVTSRVRVNLFWLGRAPLNEKKQYLLKMGSAKTECHLEAVHTIQDASTLALKAGDTIARHEVADCDLRLSHALAFDLADEIAVTGRFVLVEDYEIRGGGTIREALKDEQAWVREKVLLREYKWEKSTIPATERATRFRQKPALVLITGEKDSGKKPLARALEAELHSSGYAAYFLGIGNVLYGIDADIKGIANNRLEHIRRLAEVAHIMLDAGFILIVTAIELSQEELEVIQTSVQPDQIVTIWRGAGAPILPVDLSLPKGAEIEGDVDRLRTLLLQKGIVNGEW